MGGVHIKRVYLLSLTLLISLSFGQNCTGITGFKAKTEQESESSSIAPFSITRTAPRLLPLAVRLSKIDHLMGGRYEEVYSRVHSQRSDLGDYDHANGIAIDVSLTQTRLAAWAKAIQPVCQSTVLKSRFPYPSHATSFIRAAYGRELKPIDQQVLTKINTAVSDSNQQFEVLCTVILSSLEFNT